MPSVDTHLAVADRNQGAIELLLAADDTFPEWIAVIAFYKALHLVEAVLAKLRPVRHSPNHEVRDLTLKSDNRLKQIYKMFRPLKSAASVARCLADNLTGIEYGSFADYMTFDEVRDTLLGHYLKSLEASARKLLSA